MNRHGWLKGVLIVVLMVGYALGSHFSLVLPEGKKIAAALALAVPAAVLWRLLFQWIHARLVGRADMLNIGWHVLLASGLAIAPILFGLWLVWPIVIENTGILYFVQHVGTNALLAWVFGHTLADGATPLVVSFARIVHPDLPLEIALYARKVTVAWTMFFVVTCIVSAVLFLAAPLSAWSVFAVLLQWPTVAAFFVGEYLLRRSLFRQFEHASLSQGFDAYRSHQAAVDLAPSTLPERN